MAEEPNPRRPRADAQRNRERLIAAARQAFSERGAAVTMEEIGKTAGVGAGTLYRNFPSREALLEAVYRAELDRLDAAEADLSARLPPVEALEAWLLLFVDYIETKRLIWPVVVAMIADQNALIDCSSSTMTVSASRLVRRAIASGDLREDLQPIDLLWALYGAGNSTTPDGAAMARRLVGILVRGARRVG